MQEHDPIPHAPAPVHRRRAILGSVRSNFLTGIVVIAPVAVTIWLFWSLAGWVDGFVMPLVPAQFQPDALIMDWTGTESHVNIRGLGVIFFVIFTVIVGWLAKGLIGRSVLRYVERMVDRMPVIRSVYNGLKQIAETVFSQSESSFERACLVEYPRPGLWALAFISTSAKGEIREKTPTGDDILSVFLPTTPNPTSGFLLYVPRSDVIELDMSVEDAAKLIISAGLVYPSPKTEQPPVVGR